MASSMFGLCQDGGQVIFNTVCDRVDAVDYGMQLTMRDSILVRLSEYKECPPQDIDGVIPTAAFAVSSSLRPCDLFLFSVFRGCVGPLEVKSFGNPWCWQS